MQAKKMKKSLRLMVLLVILIAVPVVAVIASQTLWGSDDATYAGYYQEYDLAVYDDQDEPAVYYVEYEPSVYADAQDEVGYYFEYYPGAYDYTQDDVVVEDQPSWDAPSWEAPESFTDDSFDPFWIPVETRGVLAVTVNATQDVVTTTETVVMQRIITPTKTVTPNISRSFSSVTATTPEQWALRSCPTVINTRNGNPIHGSVGYNPLVVRNSNHFTYARLPHASLVAGEVFDLVLVVGNNFNQIGNATVSYARGLLTITFEHELHSGSWGAISFNNMRGVPNNGNIHSIGGGNALRDMIAIGATSASFSHNVRSNSVTIPAASPTAAGYVYLYMHGSFAFNLGGSGAGEIVDVVTYVTVETSTEVSSITNIVDTSEAVTVVLNNAGVEALRAYGNSLTTLVTGVYTVNVTLENQLFTQTVNVLADQTTNVNAVFTLPTVTETVTNEVWLPDYIAELVILP